MNRSKKSLKTASVRGEGDCKIFFFPTVMDKYIMAADMVLICGNAPLHGSIFDSTER